jgi:uncharacterized DUF497 family protein
MDYHDVMQFEWDETKSDACLAGRGFDFTYILPAFLDANRLVLEDTRWDYGEDRYQLLGCVGQRVFLVVFTRRDAIVRIISARKANRREIEFYENSSRKN